MKDKLHPDNTEGKMAILDTFTTTGPLSVCYPRLNSTLPPEKTLSDGIEMQHPGSLFDRQSLDLMNKFEGLSLGSTVGFLLIE